MKQADMRKADTPKADPLLRTGLSRWAILGSNQ